MPTVNLLRTPCVLPIGALGDCWLLSALALLAERPHLLEALLPTRVANDAGAYHVRLCCDGEWRTLLVDDLLPCRAGGATAFGSAARRQLWVPLVEKACAKAFGSYEALEGGTIAEALALLTGFPTERLTLQARDTHEIHARYTRDAHEIHTKCVRDTHETHARCVRDTA